MNGPVFLVGLSGSGKTTVGRLLAGRLQLPFVDTDALIEQRAGKPIVAIFASEGEAAFRDLERRILAEVSQRPAVVSTGGGAPVDPVNRTLLSAQGFTFWLDARTDTLVDRLSRAQAARPLLQDDLTASLERLRHQRHAAYAACGSRIDTSDLAPAEVVAILAERLRTETGAGQHLFNQGNVAPVWIETRTHSYGAYVGAGLFDRLPEFLQRHGLAGRLHVIVDEAIAEIHAARIRSVIGRLEHTWHPVPGGEEHKSLDQASRLYDDLLSQRPERGDLILALGGGVIGDLAGFIAATLLRGIRFVQVPTTILSQVDSSVGGKVAVDHPRGKNLIGAFHQPSLVLADLDFLQTLPPREVGAGLTEIVKISVMQDENLFASLERSASDLRALEPAALEPAIRRAIELKARLVEQDERDLTGARALLNYGHTLGQALEAATDYGRFLHGEAVAIGMGAAARMSNWIGWHPIEAVQRQDALLGVFGLPEGAPGTPEGPVREALRLDKKRESGVVKWVLPVGIGVGRSGCDVPDQLVDRALDWMLEDVP